MSRYAFGEGSCLQSIGDGWVAFSALSGETLVLNTEAAAVLEFLLEGPLDETDVGRALAAQTDMPVELIHERLRASWSELLDAGLIRVADEPTDNGA